MLSKSVPLLMKMEIMSDLWSSRVDRKPLVTKKKYRNYLLPFFRPRRLLSNRIASTEMKAKLKQNQATCLPLNPSVVSKALAKRTNTNMIAILSAYFSCIVCQLFNVNSYNYKYIGKPIITTNTVVRLIL